MNKEFRIKQKENKIELSIPTYATVELDMDDVCELISDLQAMLDRHNINEVHSNNDLDSTGWDISKKEAYEQAKSKLALQKEMRRVFVDVLDTEYLETKFATLYKLDELNREVEITKKKLQEKSNKK